MIINAGKLNLLLGTCFVTFPVLLTGCDRDDFPRLPGTTTVEFDYSGEYSVSGTWDLSGPFGNGKTFGDHVGELMVHRIVSTLGVPSLAQDEARDVVRSTVHGAIKDSVDARVPATLAPGGEVYKVLAMTLTSVKANESIILVAKKNAPTIFLAKETMTKITIPTLAGEIEIPLQDLKIDNTDIVRIEADFEATVSEASTLEFEAHNMEMRIGQLLVWIFENLVSEDIQSQTTALLDTVDCSRLTSAVSGGAAAIEVTVAGQRFELSSAMLTEQCEALHAKLTSRILGLFDPDTKVSIGGTVNVADTNADKIIDTLSSGADYGGEFQVVGAAFNPVVSVSFSATRD